MSNKRIISLTFNNESTLKDLSECQQPSDPEDFESYLETPYLNIKTLDEIKPFVIDCYQESCSENVFFICKCSGDIFLTCKTHISLHLLENPGTTHSSAILNNDFNDINRNKLISYIENENLSLRKLKQNIKLAFKNHLTKMQKEIDSLNQKINMAIEENDGKILKCRSGLPTTYENIDNLTEFIESDFSSEFTKINKQLQISHKLMRIIENVVNDWNTTQSNNASQA